MPLPLWSEVGRDLDQASISRPTNMYRGGVPDPPLVFGGGSRPPPPPPAHLSKNFLRRFAPMVKFFLWRFAPVYDVLTPFYACFAFLSTFPKILKLKNFNPSRKKKTPLFWKKLPKKRQKNFFGASRRKVQIFFGALHRW